MGRAIGEVLAFAVGVALSPLAIVAMVVMLVAPGSGRRAGAFAGAWVTSLALVATAMVVVADEADASADGAPATWVSIAKIVIGALLLGLAARQWRTRPRGGANAEPPGWIRKLDGITAARAAGLATLFNVAKPKNLLLTIGAGMAVAQVGATAAGQAVAIAVFALLGTAGLATPLAIHVLMPGRGRSVLVGLRDWMVRENAAIIATLAVVIAAKLIGDAVVSLTA